MMFRLAILLVVVFVGCSGKIKVTEEITCYEIFRKFPQLSEDAKLEKYDSTSMFIYLEKDYIIYQVPYIWTNLGRGPKDFSQKKMYHYFVQENKNNWGYTFNSRKPGEVKQISLDSVLLTAVSVTIRYILYLPILKQISLKKRLTRSIAHG